MRNKILISLLLIFSMGCAQSKSKPITDLSQNDIKNATLIDVRTPEEFAGGHIDNAKNINWYDQDFANQLQSFDKNETIYVYCKKGGRSAKAAHALDSLGYKKVVDLLGGYDAYRNK